MVAVRVMQMTLDEVVDVVAVGDRFVATVGTVDVVIGVCFARVLGGARRRIGGVYFEGVLIHVVVVNVMQVAVVEIVDVVFMFDGRVSAAFAMYVLVRSVFLAAHVSLPSV